MGVIANLLKQPLPDFVRRWLTRRWMRRNRGTWWVVDRQEARDK